MRIAVIGTGLVGGSIGLACMQQGHEVVGFDRIASAALELGAVKCMMRRARHAAPAPTWLRRSAGGLDRRGGRRVLEPTRRSSPTSVRSRVRSSRKSLSMPDRAPFVAGHPMAGSEQEGIDGRAATCSSVQHGS
jgi:prephenate dehydrogenase